MLGLKYNCRKTEKYLSDGIDSPLSPSVEKKVAAHLVVCSECREKQTFYHELKKLAGSLVDKTPPNYIWERISLRVEHPWGDEEDRGFRRFFGKLITCLPVRRINFAGAVATSILIMFLSLVPGGRSDYSSAPTGRSVQAEDFDSGNDFLSLYMMADDDRYPMEVREYYLNQLEGLNQKIKMVKTALDRFPENRHIKAHLAMAYEAKIRLYHHLGSIDNHKPKRPFEDYSNRQRGDNDDILAR